MSDFKHKDTPWWTLTFGALVTIVCAVILGLCATALKPTQDEAAKAYKLRFVLKAFGLYDNAKPLTNSQILSAFVGEKQEGKGLDGKFILALALDKDGKPMARSFAQIVEADYYDTDMKPVFLRFDSAEKLKAFQAAFATAGAADDKLGAAASALVTAAAGSKLGADGYCFPIQGKGLWSTCYGFLAIKADVKTVTNIVYYQHGETPGLGGEIETEDFQAQFKNDKLSIWDDKANAPQHIELTKDASKIASNPSTRRYVPMITASTFTSVGVTNMLKKMNEEYAVFLAQLRGGK